MHSNVYSPSIYQYQKELSQKLLFYVIMQHALWSWTLGLVCLHKCMIMPRPYISTIDIQHELIVWHHY